MSGLLAGAGWLLAFYGVLRLHVWTAARRAARPPKPQAREVKVLTGGDALRWEVWITEMPSGTRFVEYRQEHWTGWRITRCRKRTTLTDEQVERMHRAVTTSDLDWFLSQDAQAVAS